MELVAEPGWDDEIDLLGVRILGDVANDIADDARAVCPVDTGALLQSIGSSMAVAGDAAYVEAGADYASAVEEGHRVAYRGADGFVHYTGGVVPAQPFLRPSLYRERQL
jgi:hypothetical protein